MTLLRDANGTAGQSYVNMIDRLDLIEEAPINVDHPDYGGNIATAISTAASATRGRVYIPSAARTITSTLSVSSSSSAGLEIFGDGELSVLTMANTASLIGFDIGASSDRVTIRDLYIKGSTAQGAGSESHAIRFQDGSYNGKVMDVRIHQPGGDGIRFEGCVSPHAERCYITDCDGNGITVTSGAVGSNQARIIGNWVQSCTGNGVYCGRVEHPIIRDNTFEVNGNSGNGNGGTGGLYTGQVYLFETLFPVVDGNYFEDGGDFELRYGDGGGGWSVDGSIVDNEFAADLAANAAPISVWLEASFRTEMARNKFSSSLSSVKNLQCDSATRGLVLRRQQFANTSLSTGVTFADGRNTALVEPCNLARPTVAAAAATTLPGGFPLVEVTGTTAITSMTAQDAGTVVTLLWTDASPGTFTDGGNLLLAGSYSPTTNDTITVKSTGANWVEMCRSGNV